MTTKKTPKTLTIQAQTTPTPQGSKRAFRNKHTGRISLVESAGQRLKDYRRHVTTAALRAANQYDWTPPATGIQARITFHLPRPKSHYRTGRNAHLLKPTSPARPTTKPDIDKLVRATLDALTDAEVIPDDSHITTLVTAKRYAPDPQVTIDLTEDTTTITENHDQG